MYQSLALNLAPVEIQFFSKSGLSQILARSQIRSNFQNVAKNNNDGKENSLFCVCMQETVHFTSVVRLF